jgi:hypothetical protein
LDKNKPGGWMQSYSRGWSVHFFLDLTGVSTHQWIGVITSALVALYLATHWNWVSAVSQRLDSCAYHCIDSYPVVGICKAWPALALGRGNQGCSFPGHCPDIWIRIRTTAVISASVFEVGVFSLLFHI